MIAASRFGLDFASEVIKNQGPEDLRQCSAATNGFGDANIALSNLQVRFKGFSAAEPNITKVTGNVSFSVSGTLGLERAIQCTTRNGQTTSIQFLGEQDFSKGLA
ncbi:MAG: hypothetical protein AAGK25_10165 [Pseudomonadota bacterium]